jgi:hypothetical protein
MLNLENQCIYAYAFCPATPCKHLLLQYAFERNADNPD